MADWPEFRRHVRSVEFEKGPTAGVVDFAFEKGNVGTRRTGNAERHGKGAARIPDWRVQQAAKGCHVWVSGEPRRERRQSRAAGTGRRGVGFVKVTLICRAEL